MVAVHCLRPATHSSVVLVLPTERSPADSSWDAYHFFPAQVCMRLNIYGQPSVGLVLFCGRFRSIVKRLSLLLTMAQNSTGAASTNPYLDPKDDPYNPLKYVASNTLTAVAICTCPIPYSVLLIPIWNSFAAVVLTTALIHTFWLFRYRTKWMLTLVIGEYCECLYLLLSL